MPPQSMTLGGRTFVIKSATLLGWLNSLKQTYSVGLSWVLTVECESAEIDGMDWAPTIQHENLKFDIRRWVDIEGQRRVWNKDTARQGRQGATFYITEYGDMGRGDIAFGSRNGSSFDLSWSGLCDPHMDEEFGTDVPFSLNCIVAFTGITVMSDRHQTDATLAQTLSVELSLDKLDQQPLRHMCHRHRSTFLNALAHIAPRLRMENVLADFTPAAT